MQTEKSQESFVMAALKLFHFALVYEMINCIAYKMLWVMWFCICILYPCAVCHVVICFFLSAWKIAFATTGRLIKRDFYSRFVWQFWLLIYLVWSKIFDRTCQFDISSGWYCYVLDDICELRIIGQCCKIEKEKDKNGNMKNGQKLNKSWQRLFLL